jgi:hypothetical protein
MESLFCSDTIRPQISPITQIQNLVSIRALFDEESLVPDSFGEILRPEDYAQNDRF